MTLDIPLPAAHRHGPPSLHEKAIADVDLVGRRQGGQTRRIPVKRHADAQSTIHHAVQQAAIAARALGWLEQHEVGPEAHLSRGVARRFVEVHDAPIGRVARVDREMHLAIDALVVGGEGGTTGDFEMRHGHSV